MLTPGEVLTANSTSLTSNRVFGDSNNVENHLNEILNPFRNLPTSKEINRDFCINIFSLSRVWIYRIGSYFLPNEYLIKL